IAPVSLQLPQPNTKSRVFLSNIDLEQLLALQPKAEIAGSGRLNGELPVSFNGSGLHISNGIINAQPPGGHLSYTPPDGMTAAASNYGLDLALKALDDFNYHHLSLGISYQPDGTLLLDTHLKGHNPKWQQGQPIDFNIRIEQNLLKLLQALQFSDKLSEGLDKRIQQQMN
ncbi:MAG: YdbH domain-containing protein, partial [Motiliproteus sp.]|nr:YdbH domain-containing protein [Motiliproteus sp.]